MAANPQETAAHVGARKLSRREFMRGVALTGAGLVAAACGATVEAQPPKTPAEAPASPTTTPTRTLTQPATATREATATPKVSPTAAPEKKPYKPVLVDGRAAKIEKNPLVGLEKGSIIALRGCGYRAMSPNPESVSNWGINTVDNEAGEQVRFLGFVRQTQHDVFMKVAPQGPGGEYWMGNPVYMRVPEPMLAGVMGEDIETFHPEVRFDDQGRRLAVEEYITGTSAANMEGMLAEGEREVERDGKRYVESFSRVVQPVIGENVRLPEETVVIAGGIETRLESPREDLPNGVHVVMVKHTLAEI